MSHAWKKHKIQVKFRLENLMGRATTWRT